MAKEPRFATADPLCEAAKRPKIVSQYRDYAPPFEVEPIVARMLESVPSKYMLGLGEIVLTNASGLPRRLRRSVTKSRKRKASIAKARGLYYAAWQGRPAWIELFVDNILNWWGERRWSLKLTFIREILIGDVLFHEIGHHIHATVRPEFREREDVADVWKVRLKKQYNRNRHRLLRSLLSPFRPLMRWIGKSLEKRQLARGRVSRAEYNESWKEH